jgi:hypothetical protein
MRSSRSGSIVIVALAAATMFLSAAQDLNPKAAAMPTPPRLEFVFELKAHVEAPIKVGVTAGRERRIIPIGEGTFEGPGIDGKGIRGKVQPGGADYQVIQPDGFTELEARYILETDQGELIYVVNRGMRHAPPEVIAKLNAGEAVDQSQIYFRVVPTFETSSPRLQWLTRTLFVSTGERYPDGVLIRFYRLH